MEERFARNVIVKPIHMVFIKIMEKNKEIILIRNQVSKAVQAAQSLEIKTAEQQTVAVDILAKIKQVGKLITEKKESITKPLNEALKNARALFKPIEEQYELAEKIVKDKMVEFAKAQEVKAEKITQRVENGTMKFETAANKIVELTQTQITGNQGTVQYRTVKKLEIYNAMELPRKYLLPNETLIKADLMAGLEVPGAKLVEEKIVAVR